MEHLTYVECINTMRQAEKSCPVCRVPLAKGNLELLVPAVSVSTYTHCSQPCSCSSSLRARSPSWVQLSRSQWILADSCQVRILCLTPGMISVTLFRWCDAGRRITTASTEEKKHTKNVTAWDRARTGFTCPEPPACSAREGKSRLGWA